MSHEKVLVIEDNQINLELAATLLEMAGYVVLKAQDADEGIGMARVDRPSLILMDVSLPGMDGLAATGILKQDPVTNTIPVIAMTAHAMKGDRERMLAAGCDGYIEKPVSTRAFPKLVAAFLQTARNEGGRRADG